MNVERALSLGIDNYDEYIKLQNYYKKEFEEFLISKINLKNYNGKIESSELGFGKVEKEIRLKSNLKEFLNLNHFYILNNFRIEKLSKEQISILKNGSNSDRQQLIIDTYKEVIKNNFLNGRYTDKKYKINYLSSTSRKGYFDNDSLVIAIYYGNNKYKYDNKEKYLKNYIEKREYLNNIGNEIKLQVLNELNMKCDIIVSKI